jgi:heterodisulfide reductase subunit A-like polyferredoxin
MVVGGGPAGHERGPGGRQQPGTQVFLVEKEAELGGYPGQDGQVGPPDLRPTRSWRRQPSWPTVIETRWNGDDDLITVYTGTTVAKTGGYARRL